MQIAKGIGDNGVRVAMERKPCVFASFRGQLELLNCISRVSEGSELTALQRLGQAEVIAPVKVDVLVHQRGKTLDGVTIATVQNPTLRSAGPEAIRSR